jgi:hypothetical protein
MQYLVGLVVFSGIGSFLISDTIDFWREFRKSDSRSQLGVDFLRLAVLAGMASIGYWVATDTYELLRPAIAEVGVSNLSSRLSFSTLLRP